MTTIPAVLEIPLGEVVKSWREHRGLSVTEFAERAGISKAYVSELEHRKIETPGKKRMSQLATGLAIDYWDLVQRRMPPTSPEDTGPVPSEAEIARHPGGFVFAAPIKPAGQGGPVNEKDDERLLRRLSDQVDEARRILDILLARKERSHDDHSAR